MQQRILFPRRSPVLLPSVEIQTTTTTTNRDDDDDDDDDDDARDFRPLREEERRPRRRLFILRCRFEGETNPGHFANAAISRRFARGGSKNLSGETRRRARESAVRDAREEEAVEGRDEKNVQETVRAVSTGGETIDVYTAITGCISGRIFTPDDDKR